MIQLAIFINLFFAPMLSIYLYFKKRGKPLEPSLEFLVQYGITVCCNYALARMLLTVPHKLLGLSYSVDSAHYTLAALLAAWLLTQLFRAAKHIRISLDITRLGGGEENAGQTTKPEEEPYNEEATNR